MKEKFCHKNILLAVIAIVVIICTISSVLFSSQKNVAFADATINEITVFSWEDYIDLGDEETSSILKDFENETGIKVNYYTFATNEAMYNELKKDPSACDLVCPSEYMILKMKSEKLIKPYQVPNNYNLYGSSYIRDVFKSLGLENNDGTTYATGYMWGTMGLIYNADKYTADDFKSWNNLLTDNRFKGKITIKDSLRDTYIMALAMVYQEELTALNAELANGKDKAEYQAELTEIFNRVDQDSIDKVGEILNKLKKNLHSFEVDGGKIDLLTGKVDVNFAWSGDAVYAIDEASVVSLGYAVPDEGSNVWFDGWVMTQAAVGVREENAIKFLDYICKPESAVRNMEYIGYTSCIAGDEVFDYVYEGSNEVDGTNKVDLKYFFDPSDVTEKYVVNVSDENLNARLFAQYADEETISRCAVMNNFTKNDLEKLNKMWNSIKFITLPNIALILIIVAIVIAIIGWILFKFRERIFSKNLSTEQTKPRKKGYTVVKIEKIDMGYGNK